MAMEQEELASISSFVIRILQSPTWAAPISNFIDEKCGIFEDVEENKLEYTQIHNQFKTLIDELLAGHLEELSVTTDQFTRFCEYGLVGNNELYRDIVEELISVDDFLVFKAMMVKRNAEIHRETLGTIMTSTPSSGEAHDGSAATAVESFDQTEQLDAERRCVEAQLNIAQALSLQLEKRLQLMEELNRYLDLIAKVHRLQADLLAAEVAAEQSIAAERALEQQAAYEGTAKIKPVLSPIVCVRPLHEAPCTATTAPVSDINSAVIEQKKAEVVLQRDRAQRAMAAPQAATHAVPPQPTEEERRARAEHLKRQRELLIEKKQRDRENELNAYQQAHGPTAAARAAEKARMHTGSHVEQDSGKRLAAELSGQVAPAPQNPLPDPEAAAKEMRRMITRQLKQTLTQSMVSSG